MPPGWRPQEIVTPAAHSELAERIMYPPWSGNILRSGVGECFWGEEWLGFLVDVQSLQPDQVAESSWIQCEDGSWGYQAKGLCLLQVMSMNIQNQLLCRPYTAFRQNVIFASKMHRMPQIGHLHSLRSDTHRIQ